MRVNTYTHSATTAAGMWADASPSRTGSKNVRARSKCIRSPPSSRATMAFASTTLVLFSDNGLPSLVAGDTERYALSRVVRETAGDVVYRFDAHRPLLRDDADVVGAERLAHVARQRDLPLAGDLGGLYNGAHALLRLVCFTGKHSTERARSSTQRALVGCLDRVLIVTATVRT